MSDASPIHIFFHPTKITYPTWRLPSFRRGIARFQVTGWPFTIVRHSLSPPLGNGLGRQGPGCLGAVEDQGFGEKMAFEKGLLGVERYFNSGVLLVDLVRWREENCGKRCLEFSRTNTLPTIWHDQTMLNAVLKGRVFSLGQEWNLMAYPSIVHYTAAKPWLYEMRHVPFSETYWKAVAKTPWGSREALERKAEEFRKARLREAWRHPWEAVLRLVGLGERIPTLPNALLGAQKGAGNA
jgi:lipopolysaccharide biosynthesis glycosyltransferase